MLRSLFALITVNPIGRVSSLLLEAGVETIHSAPLSVGLIIALIIALVVTTIAALALADRWLTLIAVAPSLAGTATALATAYLAESPPTAVVALTGTVGVGGLVTTLWLIRSYPAKEPHAWLGSFAVPACTAALGLSGAALACVASNMIASNIASTVALGMIVVALGQVVVVRPALNRLFHRPWVDVEGCVPGSSLHRRRVLDRYAHLPPTLRYWARGKLQLDPLFRSLHNHVPRSGNVLDVGCGYGLPSAWLAVVYPDLHFVAFDALAARARYAQHVLGHRAKVFFTTVEDWREPSLGAGSFDVILCIDVIHHVREPVEMLRKLAARMRKDGVLLLRTTIQGSASSEDRSHRVERLMVWLRGQHTVRFYEANDVVRDLREAGFGSVDIEPPAPGHTETLFIAQK